MKSKHSMNSADILKNPIVKSKSIDSSLISTKKQTRFFHSVSTILIPTRQEYTDAELVSKLWYHDHQMTLFKAESKQEILGFLTTNGEIANRANMLKAQKKLYQPPPDIEFPDRPRLTRGAFVYENKVSAHTKNSR